jgi:hypothetical protein
VIAMMKRAKGATLAEIVETRAGRSTQSGGSSASWGARAGRRSSPRRTPPASAATASRSSLLAKSSFSNAASGYFRGGVSRCVGYCCATNALSGRRTRVSGCLCPGFAPGPGRGDFVLTPPGLK